MTNATMMDLLGGINPAELMDMTQVQSGGSRGLLPSGTAYVRPCLYIEYGIQTQPEFNGIRKDPAPMAKLGFRIVGGGGLNMEGKPEKYVLEAGNFPLITTYDFGVSLYEKAKMVKYHQALNRVGNKSTHIIQKIMEQPLYALTIGVKKNNKGKDVQDIDFANLQPALNQETFEPRTGDPVLDLEKHIQVFLWDHPTKQMWGTIHIAGQWDARTDEKTGKVTPAKSKNFHQEKCYAAHNFEGSALHTMLMEAEGGFTMPELSTVPDVQDTPAVPEVPQAPAGEVPAVPDVPAVPEL